MKEGGDFYTFLVKINCKKFSKNREIFHEMILQKRFSGIDRSVIYFLYNNITILPILYFFLSYLPTKLHPCYAFVSWQFQTLWNGCCAMFRKIWFILFCPNSFRLTIFPVLIMKLLSNAYWILVAYFLWMDILRHHHSISSSFKYTLLCRSPSNFSDGYVSTSFFLLIVKRFLNELNWMGWKILSMADEVKGKYI